MDLSWLAERVRHDLEMRTIAAMIDDGFMFNGAPTASDVTVPDELRPYSAAQSKEWKTPPGGWIAAVST